MVAHVSASIQVEGPDEVAFPVAFLMATTFAATGGKHCMHGTFAEVMAIRHQVVSAAWTILA